MSVITTNAQSDADDILLIAENIDVRFGGLRALSDVSIRVSAGSIVGLVGPNGAGKSTLFGVLSGILRPNAGRVYLFGEDVTAITPQARARLGLARTFQQPELFANLTAREHLVLAYRVHHARSRLWKDVFTGGSLRRPEPDETERVDQLLQFLSLAHVAHQPVNSLPLGTSRLVEVGKALASSPSIVLLDEPLAGLDVNEASRLASALRRTAEEENVALLLVEHDVDMVLRLSSYVYVLDFGSLIAAAPPEVIRDDPQVRAAYLGDFDLDTAPRRRRQPAMSDEAGLVVTDLHVNYGTSKALLGVSLEVATGSVLAVLGPNGAGKSSLARAVSGLVPVTAGHVHFGGQDITGWLPHRIHREGLIYIPEGRGIFPGLSVIDNLRMATHQIRGRAERQAAVERAIELFPILGNRSQQRGGSLSGGEQQMLALARALAVDPRLIIADEMSLGLAPIMVDLVFDSLRRARQMGITIVLIEQFVDRALAFADTCVILGRGCVGWAGNAADAGEEVLERYLGEVAAAPTESLD